jgi:hypothetical protein
MALSALIWRKFIRATRERLVVVVSPTAAFFSSRRASCRACMLESCEMMNRFESLLKSNFFPRHPRSLYAHPDEIHRHGRCGRSDVKCTQKGAARICSARRSINQRAACRYDPPQQSAALFLLLSSSPLLLLRHYSPVSARDGWPRVRENASACAESEQQLFTSDTKSSVNNCA